VNLNKSKDLSETERKACFILASFDNLNKNQSFSIVGSGKDESGFHGTTIQAVALCHSSHSHTPFTNSTETKITRDRNL
jgi:adenosylmethionine-8-amino-7-oxononanoate aminotransferase